tara:strand:+ start:750 stop:1688 length:939 start_codon:yes stop_codon:yes gene_type:complete
MFLVNPAASSVTPRTRVVIQKALASDHQVVLAETIRRDHATKIAREAAEDHFDIVVVLGGDGTLNEAANGLINTDTALAVLPGGSTNVFARTLGLPDDPVEATGILLETIDNHAPQRIGLGCVNGRYFLFHAGMGFDAAVVAEVEKRGRLKRYASHALFVYAAIDTWLRHYDRKKPAFRIRHSNGAVVPNSKFGICLNTDPYTYLGSRSLSLSPDADLSRSLVMISINSLRVNRLLNLVSGAIRGSTAFHNHSYVDYRADVTDFRVEGHRPFPYQVDGDYLGEVTSLDFSYAPSVLKLVAPNPSLVGLPEQK